MYFYWPDTETRKIYRILIFINLIHIIEFYAFLAKNKLKVGSVVKFN